MQDNRLTALRPHVPARPLFGNVFNRPLNLKIPATIDFDRFAEWMLGILSAVWGLWVIAFAGDGVLTYLKINSFFPSWAMGIFFVAVGILSLVARGRYERMAQLMLFGGRFAVAMAFFIFDFQSTGGIVYLSIAFLHAGLYWVRVSQTA